MLRLSKVKRWCQANDTCYHLWGGRWGWGVSHCMEESKEHSNACHQQPRMSTCSVVCKSVRVTKKDTTHTGTGGKSALLREATEQNQLQ